VSRVLVAVTGSVAAYKAATVVSRLVERHEVWVLMTQAAEGFVQPATFAALSGREVLTEAVYRQGVRVPHVAAAAWAEAMAVVPASQYTLGLIAQGLAGNVVAATALSFRGPLLVAPAMESGMWEHPTTAAHVATLRARGVQVLEPATGRLASGAQGVGRMREPEEVVEAVEGLLAAKDLRGVRALVTAGPTREHLDPVRFLSNPSSGRMGYALARRLRDRGAEVTLVSGPTHLPAPFGVTCIPVVSTADMAAAVDRLAAEVDVVIGAAAPADLKPVAPAAVKRRKGELGRTLAVEETVDILATLGRRPDRPLLVGFAAETGDPRAEARRKRREKHLDLVVANDVAEPGAGFAVATNHVYILGDDGEEEVRGTKEEVADRILDRVRRLLLDRGR
jgi:phosphopantothenoylcysteine decarboxylase/phosphopantothenate--cysteine ligase